eukprot:m.472105 g.472105  ORF g.472105 m.472105 type:complete len:60 (-) comp57108_c0_seq16:1485-1664(-)
MHDWSGVAASGTLAFVVHSRRARRARRAHRALSRSKGTALVRPCARPRTLEAQPLTSTG